MSHLHRRRARHEVLLPKHDGEKADDGAQCHAQIRGRRQPTECTRAVLRLRGIGDVGLDHADSTTARSLHDPREEKQEDRIGETEDQVRNCRRA
jgi:hypothetical protein